MLPQQPQPSSYPPLTQVSCDTASSDSLLNPLSSLQTNGGEYHGIKNRKKKLDGEGWTINKLRYKDLGVYGREKEIEILETCLQRICDADSTNLVTGASAAADEDTATIDSTASAIPTHPSEIVLIGGFSGTGKTTLAKTIQKSIKQKGGILAIGKFDFELRNQSHAGIMQVCRGISTYISALEVSKPALYHDICEAIWKSLEATSEHFRSVVLSEFIPDLRTFLANHQGQDKDHEGKVMKDAEEESNEFQTENKNRFYHAIQSFFAIVGSLCSPLVIILDDLQWADSASFDLLESLLTCHQEQQSPMMVIGCYRSNEVGNQHVFSAIIRDMRAISESPKRDFNMTEISLGNLQVSDVNKILMELLSIDDSASTQCLAEICHRRTNGNVFFLISFVSMLQDKGLLEYSFGLMKWVWTDSIIEEKTMATTNVVDIIQHKISTQLEGNVREILKLAAFLGTIFREQLIHILWEERIYRKIGSINKSLNELLVDAIEQSFLEKIQDSNVECLYRWAHDKIHEAAISLVHPNDICDLKYQSGRILMDRLSEDDLEKSIFVVCSLLNAGSIPSDRELKIRISELNLRAARKAVRSSAFQVAAEFASKGIGTLPKEDCWDLNKELSLELYNTVVFAENAIGRVDEMRQHSNVVLEQKNCTLEDKLQVYHILVHSMTHCEGLTEGLKLCCDVLSRLGCRFPNNIVRILFSTVRGVLRVQKLSKRINTAMVLKLMLTKNMDDVSVHQMRLLDKLFTNCYMTASPLTGLVLLRMFKLTTRDGFSFYSPVAYASMAFLMVLALSDFEAGVKYADIAIDLVKTMKLYKVEARCINVVHILVYHWTRPLISSLRPFMRAYEVGLQTGDTESAVVASWNYCVYSLLTGKPLLQVAESLAIFTKQAQDLKVDETLVQLRIGFQFVLNLLGQSKNTTVIAGEIVSEENLNDKEFMRSPANHELLKYFRTLACVYFSDYESGAALAMERGDDMIKVLPGWGATSTDPFYRAFLLIVMAKQHNAPKRRYKREAKRLLIMIKKWIKKGNPNLIHQEALLGAELAALDGNTRVANDRFRSAIVQAARGGILHEAALANERYAVFLLNSMKDKEEATFYIEEAIRQYSEWGCVHKAKLLEATYMSEYE